MQIVSAEQTAPGSFSVITDTGGHMLITEASNPDVFAAMIAWQAQGNDIGQWVPPAAPALTKLHKATLWRRCTDEEAETLSFVLSQAPFRLRLIFEAAQYLDATDDDYAPLRAGIVAALGEERAAALLDPEF